MGNSAANFGLYRKVGKQVFISFRTEATSISGLSGTARIFGLPFGGPNQRGAINFCFFDFYVPVDFTMLVGYIDITTLNNGPYFQCCKQGYSAGSTGFTVTEFGANKGLGGSGMYITD